nr:hydrolase [Paenibacillus sp. R14(2021)]
MKTSLRKKLTAGAMAFTLVTGGAGFAILSTTSHAANAAAAEVQAGPVAKPAAAKQLLTPTDHTLMFIDHQPQMAFALKSHDVDSVRNNTEGLAKAAKAFKVPTILTTVSAKTFSGPIFPELQAVFPDLKPIDRTTMNPWEDKNVTDKINSYGKKKIVMAGLWTEVCLVDPVLSALDQGFEVYFISDASGGVSDEAHDMAVERMIQAGAKPMTWLQYMLELQRDWKDQTHYKEVIDIAKEHAGGYGLGLVYAGSMFGGGEGK